MTDEKPSPDDLLYKDPETVEPEEAETEDPWTPEIVPDDERPEAGVVPDIPDGDDLEPEHQFVDEDGKAIERSTEAG